MFDLAGAHINRYERISCVARVLVGRRLLFLFPLLPLFLFSLLHREDIIPNTQRSGKPHQLNTSASSRQYQSTFMWLMWLKACPDSDAKKKKATELFKSAGTDQRNKRRKQTNTHTHTQPRQRKHVESKLFFFRACLRGLFVSCFISARNNVKQQQKRGDHTVMRKPSLAPLPLQKGGGRRKKKSKTQNKTLAPPLHSRRDNTHTEEKGALEGRHQKNSPNNVKEKKK
jgi:hypothetical protein